MRSLIGALLVCGSLTNVAQAAPFTNGDFEANNGAIWNPTGIASATVNYGGLSAAPFGNFGAAFNFGDGPNNGVISQTFDTVIGQLYNVTFAAGNLNQTGGASTQSILAEALNASNAVIGGLPVSIFAPVPTATLAQVYAGSPYGFSFLATSLTSTLRFTDTGSQTISTDLFLDNINVTPAPAPELDGANAITPILFAALASLLPASRRRRPAAA